jgi:spore coat protein H
MAGPFLSCFLFLSMGCSETDDWIDEGEALGWSEESHGNDVDPNYDIVFPSGVVQRLDVWISASNYDAMQAEMEELLGEFGAGLAGPGGPPDGGPPDGEPPDGGPSMDFGADPSFVPASIGFDDRTWPYVGLRYKGNSSLSNSWQQGISKISFRLDFDEFEDDYPETQDQRFWGFKKLTFSSGFKDPSYLRETLAVEIFRGNGVPAAQATFYEVYVTVEGQDEQYWGLYTGLEDPSDAMLDAVFGDNDGNLYKPENDCADWTCFSEDNFAKKTNEDEADFRDVEAAIDALHATYDDPEAWREGLEAVFDVTGFLRWLATNTVIENWDTYGLMRHNYYVYGDPGDDGRLTWIPWDNNEALHQNELPTLTIELDEVTDEWPLIRVLMDDPVYSAAYYAEVQATLESPFAIDEHSSRAQQLWEVIAPAVEREQAPYTQLAKYQEFEDSVTGSGGLIEHVEERHAVVLDTLESLGYLD